MVGQEGRLVLEPGAPHPGGPEGRTSGAAVLGPQDVRYLHFLEGTRDYEWLEALLLNQTLVKSLLWFRYPPPLPLPWPSCVLGGCEGLDRWGPP